jgi:hypothetical protein
MKRAKIGLFLIMAAVLTVLFSCGNDLLLAPVVPGGENRNSGADAPDGLSASQGEYRSITLSWNAKPNAARYYVYRADSPLDNFVRCGETTANQFKLTVPPGSAVYYKVSAVSLDGRESSQSIFVRGTSLAQPFITDIIDITESGVTVTWYMNNAEKDTYKDNLLYTVYCFDGSTEVAQLVLDGATLAENRASFGNLKPNAQYKYQVEAYLRGDQSASEKSDRVDAATARRMRPAAPVNLRASRGTSTNTIELHFELPDEVDIALGDNQYEPKVVYFIISKRRYSESGNNVYQPYCSYFGSISANAAGKLAGKTFDGYTPGTTVKWTDANVSRGIEYEYQVQAYVDDTPKVISSDSSKASATGWALSKGTLDFGKVDYQLNAEGSLYASAQLPLVFSLDHKDVAYDYELVETIEPIADTNPNNPTGTIKRASDILGYNDIKNYIARMDLEQKTTTDTPGRGTYSYEVEIKLNGDTIDTVSNIGKIDVTEQTEKIIVESFSVQDGYKDRFVLSWQYYENRKYILYESDDGRTGWTAFHTVNANPDNNSEYFEEDFSYTHTADVEPGQTKYFAIRPYRVVGGSDHSGQMVYASSDENAGFKTLGVPELSLGTEASYGTITAIWTEAQKADAYRIKYWYTEGAEAGIKKTKTTVNASELSLDASNRLVYHFSPFENNTIDAAQAGLEIHVEVDALNEGLQTKVGGGEIATSSHQTVAKRLVGPSQLSPSASHAVSAAEIDVSWNKISGANGYYVFRRQFNMNNTAQEGTEAVVYYVPEVHADTSFITITGKELALNSGTKEDTQMVKASASFANSRYTLKDNYLPDSEYNGSYGNHTPAYKDQQNNIAQGYSYRYYVVPVVSASEPLTSIEFTYAKDGSNKNTGISHYTIHENGVNIRYNGASTLEKDGFTIGFGQNVTATKGTYTSNPSSNYPINDGIRITWSAPPRLAQAGITPVYEVWRKAYNVTTWDKITTVTNALNYIDSSASLTKGIAYEYLIGISNGSSVSVPKDTARFIASCRAMKDERGRSHMLGYMLDLVKMESVSRNEQKVGDNFAEEVKWFSAEIKNSIPDDYRWGIDGYTVFVMNRNIDGSWHEIADIPYANISNQINQSVKVAANTRFFDGRDLLRVMRDYKHYFKVHTYVLKDKKKVYSPDPVWNYETLFVANRTNQETSNFLDTDYVKWGARQITVDEFSSIATLPIAWGIHHMRGANRLNWVVHGYSTKTLNGNNGSSGQVTSEATYAANRWYWNFYNYKPSMDTRANKHPNGFQSGFYDASNGGWTWQYAVIFLTIDTGSRDGRSMIYAGAPTTSNFPEMYGVQGNYGRDPFDIKGPPNVNGMYTGKMRFDNYQLNSSSQTAGRMLVRYPASAAEVTGTGQYNVALPYVVFQSRSPAIRFENDEWF